MVVPQRTAAQKAVKGMVKHLSAAQLQQYGARELPPSEASQVIAHLDGCAACFAAFRALWPALSDPQREVSLAALLPEDEEPFHLDFELHLQPFTDGATDDITREIINSHITVCPSCAQALRELLDFRDSLRWQQTARPAPQLTLWARFAGWWREHLRAASFRAVAYAFGLLLALGLGMWAWWRWPAAPPAQVAQQQAEAITPPARAPSEPSPPTPSVKSKPAVTPPAPQTGPPATETAPADSEEKPPPGVPAEITNTLRVGNLSFPAMLSSLGASLPHNRSLPRTESPPLSAQTPALTPKTPLGVVREARPLLQWQGPAGEQQYQVTITDTQNNVIAISPQLAQAAWRPEQALPAGRQLRWQVTYLQPDGNRAYSPPVRFYRLSRNDEARLRQTEQATRSPLLRGVAYAQAGLLDEAAHAFREWLQQHPNSKTGRKFLAQVMARKP